MRPGLGAVSIWQLPFFLEKNLRYFFMSEDINENTAEFTCLNCGNSELIAPLISVRYTGEQIWIC